MNLKYSYNYLKIEAEPSTSIMLVERQIKEVFVGKVRAMREVHRSPQNHQCEDSVTESIQWVS